MEKKGFVILGIDPGTAITGYGVIRSHLSCFETLDFGCVRPPRTLELASRYLVIFNAVEQLIEKHRPDAVSVESQFVCKNVQSALKLGMAKGAVLLASARMGVPVFEYAPRKAKMAVVGSGSASKEQVQRMVQMLLNLSEAPQPEDAADALALAICHANNRKKYV